MTPVRWSPRDWVLPWLLVGTALLASGWFSERTAPLWGSLLAWVLVPLRRGPSPLRKSWGWLLAVGFGLAFTFTGEPGEQTFRRFLDLPAWTFTGLALLQLWALGRGGTRGWIRLPQSA